MLQRKPHYRLLAVGIGLAAGLILSKFWPNSPLYAVTTDRIESYGIATGALDNETEAVWLLDFLTGDLRVLVLGKAVNTWTATFNTNVLADMNLDPQRNPKFLMATGFANLRHAGGSRVLPSNAICYVAEVTSGRITAYAVPWSFSQYQSGQPQAGRLLQVGTCSFRVPVGAGIDAGPGGRPRGR
jgi:hypothetical protein